ncbi:hypothetical protein DMZ43_12120 [Meridianimaribacter sp. CL38]|uniref:hypothetical protein n=1 Tax=Meridianimaribacter sp. CL38 TaxID=2213021 RepID=UPI00104009CE|nr:hypothetical protein [Meridianimaribacter sp. CL38]TBV25675.1 hypothetical protein DMZ43_12120 [Meridianimaribacter sp. CL38]
MKNLLLFTFLISIFNLTAQDLIAVQNGNDPTFYTDLSEAIEGSVAGDTLYIPGRNYVVNDTINKPIHLIGTGINPNYTQATGITTVASSSIVLPQLVLGENADGGSITGIFFTTNYYNGNPYNNITVESGADVSNFLIDRSYFGSNVGGKFSNSLIKQNIFRHRNNFNAQDGNSLISNNIFCDRGNTFTNCKVANNIFLVSAQYYEAIDASNSIIENNILPANYAFDYLNNCNIRNNVNTSNGVSGSIIRNGNFNDSADLTTVFSSYSSISDAVNQSADFHLPDNSPYKNGGSDGNDIGIYGGRYPWKDGSVPFNPHIVSKNISGTTDENGDLPIEIEVEAQQN